MTSTQGRERVRNEGSKRKSSVCDWRPLEASECGPTRFASIRRMLAFGLRFEVSGR